MSLTKTVAVRSPHGSVSRIERNSTRRRFASLSVEEVAPSPTRQSSPAYQPHVLPLFCSSSQREQRREIFSDRRRHPSDACPSVSRACPATADSDRARASLGSDCLLPHCRTPSIRSTDLCGPRLRTGLCGTGTAGCTTGNSACTAYSPECGTSRPDRSPLRVRGTGAATP